MKEMTEKKAKSFMDLKNDDLTTLRQLLADFLSVESDPRLTDRQRADTKRGIKALRSGIEALETLAFA